MDSTDKKQAQQIEARVDAKDPLAGRPAAPPDPVSLAHGYEVNDVDVGKVAKATLALVIVSAIVFAITTGYQALSTGGLGSFRPPQGRIANPPTNPVPDTIQSRSATGQEYETLRAEEMDKLSSYGSLDDGSGAYRIPIERAMELLVERGLPAREGGSLEEIERIPLDSSSGRELERTTP